VEGVASTFARAYSHTVLSMGVGAVVAAPALQESTQSIRQIARTPKAPFITLIVLKCVYFDGVVLAIAAFASRPRAVKPLQARLSVMGLVAALFEGHRAEKSFNKMSNMFEETALGAKDDRKIVLEPTDQGGWRFRKT
jgi:hypothetical protein